MAVRFYSVNGINRDFHLIPKTPFRWMNPKVIGSYTFKASHGRIATSDVCVCYLLKIANNLCVKIMCLKSVKIPHLREMYCFHGTFSIKLAFILFMWHCNYSHKLWINLQRWKCHPHHLPVLMPDIVIHSQWTSWFNT